MTLIDTNVIIDILARDPVWVNWSAARLEEARRRGRLVINEVCYAELAANLETEPELQSALGQLGIELEWTPSSALFAAGHAFKSYRAAGGPRTNILPDFFIGAHAQAAAMPILTRDVRRYRTYFPDVELIAPPS